MAPPRGRFLVLDGADGCGKTTQAGRLVAALGAGAAGPPLHLREPGSTGFGERVRAVFLDPEVTIGPAAEALLVCAARRQMLDEVVAPALEAGRDVVCERFHPSTFAYQGVAGGLGEEVVLALLETWAGSPRPDLTVVLDVDVEVAGARLRGAPDRVEARPPEFHRAVVEGYRRYAERAPRVVLVDGRPAADEVEAEVWREVQRARR